MFFYNEDDTEVSYQQPGESVDPYFYNTSLLLNMDNDFSDSSIYGNEIVPYGNVSHNTTESKYGGGSTYFNGNGNILAITQGGEHFNFGTDNFTIEFWHKPTSNNTRQWFFHADADYWIGIDKDVAGRYGMWASSTGTSWDIVQSDSEQGKTINSALLNQWNHIAFVRSGNSFMIFLNGNLEKTVSGNGAIFDRSNEVKRIGEHSTPSFLPIEGYIDDFRVTKGVARYTTNFTPPTEAHPTTGPSEIVSTDLQLHLDAGDTNSYPGTGTTWYDLSGNGYNGTLSGTSFSSDVGGNIVFNGSADVSHGIINLTNSFTYWSWVKVSARSDMHTLLANAAPGPNNGFKFTVNTYQNNNRNLGLELNNGSGDWNTAVTDSGLIQADVWYNVAFSFENTTGEVKLYVNGNLKDSYSNFVSNINTNQNLLAGKMFSGYGLQGNKAVYTIYSKILKDAEVLQNFHATKDRFGL